MPDPRPLHVVMHGDGWAVVREGSERPTSIHYTEQSKPIVQSRALVRECLAMGICAETLFGKKELQLG